MDGPTPGTPVNVPNPGPGPSGSWPTGVQPITPEDGVPVWQPTVYTQDSDASIEEKAAAWYDSIYGGTYNKVNGEAPTASTSNSSGASIPSLSMAYTTAPDLIPLPDTGGQASGSSTGPLAEPFAIQLGMLMSCEQTFLEATNATIQAYEDLSTVVTGAINSPSIFGQIVGRGPVHVPGQYGGHQYPVSYSEFDSEGQAFASAMIPQYEQALNAIGSVLEAIGTYTALLNNTGQMYATADAQSKFPPPVTVGRTGGGHGPRVS